MLLPLLMLSSLHRLLCEIGHGTLLLRQYYCIIVSAVDVFASTMCVILCANCDHTDVKGTTIAFGQKLKKNIANPHSVPHPWRSIAPNIVTPSTWMHAKSGKQRRPS